MEVGALPLVGRSQLLPTPASLAQEPSGYLLGKELGLEEGRVLREDAPHELVPAIGSSCCDATLPRSIPEPQPVRQLEAFRKGLCDPTRQR